MSCNRAIFDGRVTRACSAPDPCPEHPVCTACGLFADSVVHTDRATQSYHEPIGRPGAEPPSGLARGYVPMVACGTFTSPAPVERPASEPWATFGPRLRALREEAGIGIGQLARRLGCRTPALSDVERGLEPAPGTGETE